MAAKPISKLNILIGATTLGLQRGLATAKSQVKGFQGKMERAFGPKQFRAFNASLTAATAVIASAAAATAGLAMAFNESRQRIDETAKAAQRLGVSFQTMSALRLAAEESGASFEQAAKGIGFLQNAMADAADGMVSTQRAFEQINIDAKELERLPIERAMNRVTSGLARVDNQARRMQITRDLFGRSGEEALLLFERIGREGLGGIRRELEALGFAMDQVDARRVEEMNDSITRSETAVSILRDKLFAVLAPAIKQTTDTANTLAAGFNRVISLSDQLTKSIGGMGEMIARVQRGMRGFKELRELADLFERFLPPGPKKRDLLGLDQSLDNAERTLDVLRDIQGISALDIRTTAGQAEIGRLIRTAHIV